jgi:chemotaxis signal transduction protein
VPAELPGLLGLSAVRGHLVPVFDLASLLGAGSHSQAPRWVALHEGKELLGLAFDEFEGTEGVPIGVLDAQDSPPGQEAQAIRVRSGLVHLVDLPAVISRISEKKRD